MTSSARGPSPVPGTSSRSGRSRIRVSDEGGQALGADGPLVDVGVTVAVAAEFDLGVVQVEAAKTLRDRCGRRSPSPVCSSRASLE